MNVSQRQTVEQLEPRLAKIEAELKEIKEKRKNNETNGELL